MAFRGGEIQFQAVTLRFPRKALIRTKGYAQFAPELLKQFIPHPFHANRLNTLQKANKTEQGERKKKLRSWILGEIGRRTRKEGGKRLMAGTVLKSASGSACSFVTKGKTFSRSLAGKLLLSWAPGRAQLRPGFRGVSCQLWKRGLSSDCKPDLDSTRKCPDQRPAVV